MKSVAEPTEPAPPPAVAEVPGAAAFATPVTGVIDLDPPALERKGRMWLLWSFLACPCHLPLTLGFLGVVLGGTALGALVRDNAWLAGGIITAVWAAGTARGLWLVRQAEKADFACAVPGDPAPKERTVRSTRSGWFGRSQRS